MFGASEGTRSAFRSFMKCTLRVAAAMVMVLAVGCSKKTETAGPLPQLRLTPDQLRQYPAGHIGQLGLAGIHATVLFGDPSRKGFYSFLLFIPPETVIQPHSHGDDRVGTVLAGTYRMGYGDTFDKAKLKDLPPGSVFTEPGNGKTHFAQTTHVPVVVQLTGFGPSYTKYVNPADAPPLQTERY
jgi:hypothetical protein